MSYRFWVLVAAGLFSAGILAGIVIALYAPSDLNSTAGPLVAGMLEQLASLLVESKFLTAIFILSNNAFTLVMSFLLSPILCLFPIMVLLLNGGIIGFLSPLVISETSLGFLVMSLLPHGILELPAIIIGEAAALSIGAAVMLAIFKKESRNLLLPRLVTNLKLLAVAIALLVPAAFIESYLTPLLITGG